MKRIHLISALLVFNVLGISQQTAHMTTVHSNDVGRIAEMPFQSGEWLKYHIRYGLVKAGEAELEVKSHRSHRGQMAYHMVGTGRTTGMTDWFFPTRDRYETYMDASTMYPLEFIRDIDEGGYTIQRHIYFNQDQKRARDTYRTDTVFQLSSNMQDIFSAFYFARTLDLSNVKVGDDIEIDVFLDHEHFPFRLRYLGIERVELDDFDVSCLKFRPIVQEGRVFEEEESMTIWVSNDRNRIPIRLQSELAVGSIKVDLVEYKNNAHPLHIVR